MSGYLKYFECESQNMAFLIEDEEVGEKIPTNLEYDKKYVEN